MQHRLLCNRLLSFRTHQNPYRRVIASVFYKVIKHANVHIHLTNIFMRKFADFQINQNKTLYRLTIT